MGIYKNIKEIMKYTYEQIMAMGKWERYDAIESMTQKERDDMNATAPKNTLIDVANQLDVTTADCTPIEEPKKSIRTKSWLRGH
jgi:hypothetical protein